MTRQICRWRRNRRYRAIVGELRGLSPRQLGELGIPPAEIPRLASAVART